MGRGPAEQPHRFSIVLFDLVSLDAARQACKEVGSYQKSSCVTWTLTPKSPRKEGGKNPAENRLKIISKALLSVITLSSCASPRIISIAGSVSEVNKDGKITSTLFDPSGWFGPRFKDAASSNNYYRGVHWLFGRDMRRMDDGGTSAR